MGERGRETEKRKKMTFMIYIITNSINNDDDNNIYL